MENLEFEDKKLMHDMEHGRTSLTDGMNRFVWCVDSALRYLHSPTIRGFRIQFDLREPSQQYIDRWIRFALRRRVKSLALILTPVNVMQQRPPRYNLRRSLLVSCSRETDLSHLRSLSLAHVHVNWQAVEVVLVTKCPRLQAIHLDDVPITKEMVEILASKLSHLLSIHLVDVDVTARTLDILLANFSHLVDLRIRQSFTVNHSTLRIVGAKLRCLVTEQFRDFATLDISASELRDMVIRDCPYLSTLNISCPLLRPLHFSGHAKSIKNINTPLLDTFHLHRTGGGDANLAHISGCLPYVKFLEVIVGGWVEMPRPGMYQNLQELSLAVIDTCGRLVELIPLLERCPNLGKFTLVVNSELRIPWWFEQPSGASKTPTTWNFGLKELNFYGFRPIGNHEDIIIQVLRMSPDIDRKDFP